MVASAARKRERLLRFSGQRDENNITNHETKDVLNTALKRKLQSAEESVGSASVATGQKKVKRRVPNDSCAEARLANKDSEKVFTESQPSHSKPLDISGNLRSLDSDTTATGPGSKTQGTSKTDAKKSTASSKRSKHILFIGNLPFTATDESIAAHFKKLNPVSIRHRVEKDSGRSKGFAFLEFENRDHLDKCLKGYHHSRFDDGEGGLRKLNVELTAGGGGGKSESRKAKLKQKNEKLNEQRKARTTRELDASEKAQTNQMSKDRPKQDSQIHPSRRARVPDG